MRWSSRCARAKRFPGGRSADTLLARAFACRRAVMTKTALGLIEALSGHHHVDGRAVPGSGERRPVIDPATEEPIGHYAEATPAEIEQAVAASRRAQRA